MNISTLLLPALLVLSVAPAFAQCGRRHSNHGGPGSVQSPSAHEGHAPKVRATNTICPVMGEPVDPSRDKEVVIRGKYYLVCCSGCGPAMSKDYDKYLDQEGRPRNDPGRDPKGESRKDAERPVPPPSTHEGHQH